MTPPELKGARDPSAGSIKVGRKSIFTITELTFRKKKNEERKEEIVIV